MSKSAIILGATGLTGGLILQKLLEDERYEKIILFSRSTCHIKHSKLSEYIVNLFELEQYMDKFKADEVFCCIGTTKSKTSDKETYKKIDYGIPVTAAALCKQNEIETFVVISALGANSNSNIFYNKIKGDMESAVFSKNIKHTYILQPSLIGGERTESRPGEFIAKYIMSLINPFLLGPLKVYKMISPQLIALCMLNLANSGKTSLRISSDQIKLLAKE
jgi:uncharacterized protein YbjT (DUF2867 family)